MATISANTLFHFTDRESLISILQNNFFPRYCREIVQSPCGVVSRMIYPMVCFCDLPLSQIGDHISRYGRYGIGLKKEWGLARNLNPVIYLQKESKVMQKLDALLLSNWESVNALPIEQLKKDRDNLIYLKMFAKPYEGTQERRGKTEDLRFYDEREWRYIPDIARLGDDELHLVASEWTEAQLTEKNTAISEFPLVFEPNDVKYIVVETEDDREGMIGLVKDIKSQKNYSELEIQMLISRIVSVESINSDM